MADRWMDDREERDWRNRERRAQRYGRDDDYGSSDYTQRDYALGDYDTGYRSFQPRDYERRQRPVFGERETGADYTGPRYGAGGYSGYVGEGRRLGPSGGRDYGGRDYGDQDFRYRSSYGRNEGGGRYYGDDGRSNLYRGEFTSPSPSDRSYSDYRTQRAPTERDFGSDRAYGGGSPGPTYGGSRGGWQGGRYERDDRDDHPDRGQSFWSRASQRVASWFGEYDDDDRRDTRYGSHRGRGPQGYKRSDERISDEAHERLTDDPWVDATNISISVSGGEVTLSGTVDEREAKHRAERIVEDISGVHHVQNNIRIERGNVLTGSGRGFGDSASEAQTRSAGTTGQASSGDGDLTLSGGKTTGRTQ